MITINNEVHTPVSWASIMIDDYELERYWQRKSRAKLRPPKTSRRLVHEYTSIPPDDYEPSDLTKHILQSRSWVL